MTNVTIHEVEQRTPEWHELRVSRLTASVVGAILGHSKWKKRDDVMRDMVRAYHGLDPEFEGNVATEFGNEHEPMAIADFEITHDVEVEPVGFVTNTEWPMFGVSPDGFIGDDEGIEIKCPFSKKTQTLEEKPDYYDQTCITLLVTERERWHYFSWVDGKKPCHEEVTKEEAQKWWDVNRGILTAFHREYLEIINDMKLSKPYLEDKEIDMSEDETYVSLCKELDRLNKKATEYNDKLKAVKQQLYDMAETKKRKLVGCNHIVGKSIRKGNVDYSKIPQLKGVDLEKYRKKSSTTFYVK